MSSPFRPPVPEHAPPEGEAFPLSPPLAKPVVIALMGLPGAGKSIVAQALSERMGLRRVCRDQIRAALFPQCNYSFVEKRAAFRGVLLALEINCMLGSGSVIDGMTFSRRAELDRVAELASRHGVATLPLLLDCPPDLARERVARDIAEQRHVAADRTPETVNDVLARREPPPPETLIIDATLEPERMCETAIAAIRDSIARAAAGDPA